MTEGVWMNLKSKNDVVTAAGPSGRHWTSMLSLPKSGNRRWYSACAHGLTSAGFRSAAALL